jgi:2-haloacid dehalogenase
MTGITHLTFDCYGTLIDWESGILATVQPLLTRHGVSAAAEAILQSFVRHEARLEMQSWRPYREVLRAVMVALSADFHLSLPDRGNDVLAESLPTWPLFPDTFQALQKLSKHFPLTILSNTDDSLFALTQKRLNIEFAHIITAQQLKSYKPGQAHFHEACRRLGVPPSQILHVAQSLYHDHVPAKQLGLRTAWVTRPSCLAATGLAPEAHVITDLIVPNLATLAAHLTT